MIVEFELHFYLYTVNDESLPSYRCRTSTVFSVFHIFDSIWARDARVIDFLIDAIKLRMDKPPSTRRKNAFIIIKSYVFILFILIELRPIFAMSNKLFIIMNRSLFINLYNEFFLIIIACSSKIFNICFLSQLLMLCIQL